MRQILGFLAFFASFSVWPAFGQTSVRTGGFGPQAYIFNGQMTPFVTEIIPVVGARPAATFESPLMGKLRMAGGVQGLRPPMRLPEPEVESSGRAAYAALEEPKVSLERPAATGSSADRGDTSVAAIRRQQEVEELRLRAELDGLTAEARRLELAGDRRAAAVCYSKAAAKVEDQRRGAFLAKARELRK